MAAFLTRLNVNRIPFSQRYVRNDISWKTILFLWQLWFGNIWTNTNSIQSNLAEIEFYTEIKEKFYAKHINSNAWKIVQDGNGNITIDNIYLQRFDILHDKLNLRKKMNLLQKPNFRLPIEIWRLFLLMAHKMICCDKLALGTKSFWKTKLI